jgi:hypothetical protein
LGRTAAAELTPVYERLKELLLASTKIVVDETKMPVLDPGDAGLGRSLCSPLTRSFVCECHNIPTMPRFQPPPRRTKHAGSD